MDVQSPRELFASGGRWDVDDDPYLFLGLIVLHQALYDACSDYADEDPLQFAEGEEEVGFWSQWDSGGEELVEFLESRWCKKLGHERIANLARKSLS